MGIENGFPSPINNSKEKHLLNKDVLVAQEKIKILKDEIKGLEQNDQDISKGENGAFRVKEKGEKTNKIELDILKKEDEIRSLEKEILIIPKKEEIDALRKKIKESKEKYKNQITGSAGFRDIDKGTDPIEVQILKDEAKLRALEAEINKIKNSNKEKIVVSSVKDNEDDDFVYNGASEGFTSGNPDIILDSEYIPKDNSAVEFENKAKNERDASVYGSEGDDVTFLANGKGGNIGNLEAVESEIVEKGHNGINSRDIEDAKNGVNVVDAEHLPIAATERMTENLPAVQSERPANTERVEAITRIQQEMADARKEYLEVNYNKNKAFDRLRKYFGNRSRDEKERGYETDSEVALYRAHYDNKLLDLQKLKIEEARENGATDQELAALFIEFRAEQKINLAAEHDKVKVEQQEGSLEGLVREKVINITKSYQKLPLKVKLAIGVGMFGAGLVAGLTGGAAVGAVGALAVARRLFGGVTAGVGTRLALEARGQMKDKKGVETDEKAFLEKLKNMSEDEKYAFLSGQIKDIAIKDSENTIDKVRNQDLRQQAAGAAIGLSIMIGFRNFVSAGRAISDHFGWVGGTAAAAAENHATPPNHWSTNAWEHGHPTTGEMPNSNPQEWSTNAYENMQKDQLAAGKSWSTNAWEHSQQPVQEGVPAHEIGQELTIQKGSSIEGAINKYLVANHPDVKNHGGMAHKMFTDYMKNYIQTHHDELANSGKLKEYQEMLKTGRVNIQPGAKLIIGEHGLMGIDGDIKMLHGVDHLHGNVKLPDITGIKDMPNLSVEDGLNHAKDLKNGIDLPSAHEATPPPTVEEITKNVIDQHDKIDAAKMSERIASAQHEFKDAHSDYAKAVDKVMNNHGHESDIAANNDTMSATEKVMNQSADTIRATEAYQSDKTEMIKAARGSFEVNGHNLLVENADVEYDRAIADKELGPKLKLFTEDSLKSIKKNVKLHGGDYVPTLRPNDGETVKQYMQRVILRTIESKYGILRG